jgi:hypothetical protein
MLKIALAAAFVLLAVQSSAFAACTSDDAMTKSSDISEALMPKMSAKADDASKIMSEMGDVMGTGTVNDQTCSKLDALLTRAKKL